MPEEESFLSKHSKTIAIIFLVILVLAIIAQIVVSIVFGSRVSTSTTTSISKTTQSTITPSVDVRTTSPGEEVIITGGKENM